MKTYIRNSNGTLQCGNSFYSPSHPRVLEEVANGEARIEIAETPVCSNEELRKIEYIKRCDILLPVIQGYQLELSTCEESEKSLISQKLSNVLSQWKQEREDIRSKFA